MYVLTPLVAIGAEVVRSMTVADRGHAQKVNFIVDHGQLNINNPYVDVKTVILQNGRYDKAQSYTRPALIRPGQLIYNELRNGEFSGGNEFRRFDIRSLRFRTERVARIVQDSVNTVVLVTDANENRQGYTFNYDENGAFFIRNQDGRDARTDADYATVHLSLSDKLPPGGGSAYVIGRFNDYRLSDPLLYDMSTNRFRGKIFVKQGVVDYHYIWVDAEGKRDDTTFDGSFFETENEYQIFFYHRRPGSRWDELLGFTSINTVRQR